jgi:hypothetical protein
MLYNLYVGLNWCSTKMYVAIWIHHYGMLLSLIKWNELCFPIVRRASREPRKALDDRQREREFYQMKPQSCL